MRAIVVAVVLGVSGSAAAGEAYQQPRITIPYSWEDPSFQELDEAALQRDLDRRQREMEWEFERRQRQMQREIELEMERQRYQQYLETEAQINHQRRLDYWRNR